MEELILEYKEREHQKMHKEALAFEEKVKSFCKQVSERTGLQFTDRLLQVAINGGDQEPVLNEIRMIISGQLSNAGVTVQSIKDGAINHEIEEYCKLHNELIRGRTGVNYFYNSCRIVDGKPALEEGFFENTKDRFLRKLTTKEGIAGYKKVSKAVALLNEFIETVHPQYLLNGGLCIDYDRINYLFIVNDKAFGFDDVVREPYNPYKK